MILQAIALSSIFLILSLSHWIHIISIIYYIVLCAYIINRIILLYHNQQHNEDLHQPCYNKLSGYDAVLCKELQIKTLNLWNITAKIVGCHW